MKVAEFNTLTPQEQTTIFLKAVFHQGEIVCTTCFKEPPKSGGARWAGKFHKLNCKGFPMQVAGLNAYYSTSSFKTSNSRTTENAARINVILLDDSGEEYELPLAPSFAVQTSAYKFQAGYIISDGEDIKLAESILRSISKNKGVNDPAGNNPVRYGRLPGGVNTKPESLGFKTTMVSWHPERVYTLAEVAEVYGTVDVDDDTTDVDGMGDLAGLEDDEHKVISIGDWLNSPACPDSWGKYASKASFAEDGYELFRDFGFAIHTTGLENGREIFIEWAKQRPGWAGDNGLNAHKVWKHAKESKGSLITINTFYKMGAENGWVYFGPVSNDPPYVPEIPTDHPQQKWFPIIERLPPLMRDIAHHALLCAPYPHPIFAVFSAIFLFTALPNRLVRIGQKFWLNMYIHFLGGSTCGKDTFLKYPRRLIEQINPISIYCTSADVGSAVGLQESLMIEGRGGLVIFKDEDSSAKMQPGEREKIANLENRYFTSTGETEAWRKLKRASGGVTPPDAHCLFYSKLSASTIVGHFGADDVVDQMKSGAAARKLLVPTNMIKPIYNPKSLHTNEFSMLEAMTEWYDKLVGRVLDNQFIDLNVIDYDKDLWKTWSPETIEITAEVEAHLHRMILEFDDKFRNTENEVVRLFYGRNNEHVIKIAGALALAEDPCVEKLTIEHLDLAKRIVDLLLETTLPTVIKHAVEDDTMKDVNTLRDAMVAALKCRKVRHVEAVKRYKEAPSKNIKQREKYTKVVLVTKCMPKSMLMQNANLNLKKFESAMQTLVARGEVSKATVEDIAKGEPPIVFNGECYKLV